MGKTKDASYDLSVKIEEKHVRCRHATFHFTSIQRSYANKHLIHYQKIRTLWLNKDQNSTIFVTLNSSRLNMFYYPVMLMFFNYMNQKNKLRKSELLVTQFLFRYLQDIFSKLTNNAKTHLASSHKIHAQIIWVCVAFLDVVFR